jgi:hypothetical protein
MISDSVSKVSFPATIWNGRLRARSKLRAESLGLFPRLLDEFRAQDSFWKAGKVLHQRGKRELSPRLVSVDHERI